MIGNTTDRRTKSRRIMSTRIRTRTRTRTKGIIQIMTRKTTRTCILVKLGTLGGGGKGVVSDC